MAAEKRSKSPPRTGTITVLAGVNGAGKSSIGGAFLRQSGGAFFNPDEVARKLRATSPGLSQAEANAAAWKKGKDLLVAAIESGTDFALETTLGGETITNLLIEAAKQGTQVQIWYAGLENVELHLRRVAARVKIGGHNIPESDIRRRWIGSHQNLIRLIPWVTMLLVYDNSAEGDPASGATPAPKLVLRIIDRTRQFPDEEDLAGTPQWAKPIVAAAYR